MLLLIKRKNVEGVSLDIPGDEDIYFLKEMIQVLFNLDVIGTCYIVYLFSITFYL